MLAPQMSGRAMEAVPNENFEPAMPALTGGYNIPELSLLGTTVAGQRWAYKALHPNGDGVTAAIGIPDHTHIPITTPEFRSNFIVSSTLGANVSWDADILFLGTPDVSFLYRLYQAGTVPSEDSWKAVYYAASQPRNVKYQALGWQSDGTAKRFSFNVQSGAFGVSYPKARGMYAGMTITFDAPALVDQGRVVAAQLPLMESPRTTGIELELADANYEYVTTNVINLGSVPYSEDELFQASPGAIVWEARDGVYMPLRFNEPVHTFTSLTSGNVSTVTNQGTDVPAILGYLRPEDQKIVSFRGPNGGDIGGPAFGTAGPFNFLSGLVLFRGIDARANLSVKTRIGLEAQVERGSVVAPYQHASPALDKMAIDAVTEVAQRSNMAYKAAMNNTNGLAGIIRGILTGIKGVGNFVGDLGLPIVSGISGKVGGVLGDLGFAARMRAARAFRRR